MLARMKKFILAFALCSIDQVRQMPHEMTGNGGSVTQCDSKSTENHGLWSSFVGWLRNSRDYLMGRPKLQCYCQENPDIAPIATREVPNSECNDVCKKVCKEVEDKGAMCVVCGYLTCCVGPAKLIKLLGMSVVVGFTEILVKPVVNGCTSLTDKVRRKKKRE